MNDLIAMTARKFCLEHFCDTDLSMDYYTDMVETYLEQFDTPEDKVLFLKEVKCIGASMLDRAVKQIREVEVLRLSKIAPPGF